MTGEEAKRLLLTYGPNEIRAAKPSALGKFLRWFFSPIPLMLLAAAALSFATGKEADAGLILFLLLANYAIQRWHEHKADAAVAKLEEHLAATALALRDGRWQRIEARALVPGDRIALRPGARVPADARLLSASGLSLDESMLTGESLPKEKAPGETVYSAAYVAGGAGEAEVTATGSRTYFGAAVKTLELAKKRSSLEADIRAISKLLAGLALAAAALLTLVLFLHGGDLASLATLDISLLIAGIPVALPTVMSLIITAGVLEVAREGAVVRRLSALEDLANVNLLLSDKTGTLTENKIQVAAVAALGRWSEEAALMLAASASDPAEVNPLERALREAAHERALALIPQSSLLPADSVRKRATATFAPGAPARLASLGAPPTVAALCRFEAGARAAFDQAVAAAAARGERALLIAVNLGAAEERDLAPVAVISLADRLRADAPQTVRDMRAAGIGVKMLTGDGLPIAREVAGALGLAGPIYERAVFDDPGTLHAVFPAAGGFAEVLPEDKYRAVEEGKRGYRVAVTGDGANDLPSVSDADVGIAVARSVDALRETADIVLLSDGLAVIGTAIREARKVFVRLYHYSLYRISESARLIITILIIGLIAGQYPLTPIQVLILAFLNDAPIISIALDRVKVPRAPASVDGRRRAALSLLFALAGILNSLSMLAFAYYYLHLPWAWVQTLFFLKLVVSGHLLIYVAHTEERWFRFLPSWQVVLATSATQLFATLAAYFGFFTAAVPLPLIIFVWLWSFVWMQVAELFKAAMPAPPTEIESAMPPPREQTFTRVPPVVMP
ncbi:MAG TPA: HAD-IC family P-type ATPase [Candidatus Paceibacterota bacterium]|nr:HAD-IC family P-type ATPase [Candidatus Paceibacterota bacterium]